MSQLTKDLFLTDAELELLRSALEGCHDQDCLAIRFLLETGCRVSEALAVGWQDIDDTKALVHIRGKKGSNDRLIPLTEAMMTGLSQIKQQKKPFMKTDRWLRMVLLQRFKVKKKLHSLRHTMAVNLYKQTKDIHLVKTALGHRNIANTMIYLDFVEGEEQLKVMRSLYQKKTE